MLVIAKLLNVMQLDKELVLKALDSGEKDFDEDYDACCYDEDEVEGCDCWD